MMMPSNAEHARILKLLATLKLLESVTKELQSDATCIADVRYLFDTVIEHHPSASTRLSSDAPIVHNVDFEFALVKLQDNRTNVLNDKEREAVKDFVSTDNPVRKSAAIQKDVLTFSEQARKKRKVSSGAGVYIDTKFVIPTSNIVERLISVAGDVFGDHRHRLTPLNFEQQLFLKKNSGLWGLTEVNEIVQRE